MTTIRTTRARGGTSVRRKHEICRVKKNERRFDWWLVIKYLRLVTLTMGLWAAIYFLLTYFF